jgi:hypothetical protein
MSEFSIKENTATGGGDGGGGSSGANKKPCDWIGAMHPLLIIC